MGREDRQDTVVDEKHQPMTEAEKRDKSTDQSPKQPTASPARRKNPSRETEAEVEEEKGWSQCFFLPLRSQK